MGVSGEKQGFGASELMLKSAFHRPPAKPESHEGGNWVNEPGQAANEMDRLRPAHPSMKKPRLLEMGVARVARK